ncbi:hypothetical protein CTI50_15960 [Pseudomonas syringae pv. actinidiae]|nr:hypothetical protein B1R35_14205 [Pseudomonas syringae pv. actinidiae]NAT54783.1 hypothetical protein [Pseudomonas syringae pv. actinidiae]PIH81139.1 hypothetical protein CTI50_15960 [Pseudomonas syringae pv. actinidiae]PIH87814.1 hypothetical protein CTI51_10420 [Pseudomonas syringae pv. actinidiae]PIH91829.1 hypothetical protein CTI37_20500 [Pseudomonas syringae pv. actinidiae]
MTIVPMLRIGMQFWTLCVLFVFVTFCVTQRFCDVSWICFRLKAPFRPSATHLCAQHGRHPRGESPLLSWPQ